MLSKLFNRKATSGYSIISRCFVLLTLGACAEPHLYPVCFYSKMAPDTQDTTVYRQLAVVLQTAIGSSRPVGIVNTPDGRWLVARTTKSENAAAAKVWPRVACIGAAHDSNSVKAEADCVGYVEQFVASNKYFDFGNARDMGGFDIWNESPNKDSIVYCHSSPTVTN